MIAAGELVIEAARKAFQEQLTALRASATPNDTITLARLKEMRKKIVGLDKRVTKMQVMRVDMIVALESLDMLVDNANNLRQTLFDIRVQNIPALEQAVGIAFSVYEQRQTAQFGSRVEDQQMRTRQANIEALGHSQEEVHKASMAHVDQAAAIVKALEDLGRVRARGTELLVIAEKANAEVRAKLAEAERKFKEDAQADLEKSAT